MVLQSLYITWTISVRYREVQSYRMAVLCNPFELNGYVWIDEKEAAHNFTLSLYFYRELNELIISKMTSRVK